MTYEDRLNAIGDLLRDTILPRYKRPEHLDDDTARRELADMVTDLNAEWPVVSDERFRQLGAGLARALRLTYTGRNWPTIAHLAKALKEAQQAPTSARMSAPSVPSGDEREEWRRAAVRAWLEGGKPVNPEWLTRERLAAVGCHRTADAIAFATDAFNHGTCAELTDRDRERHAEAFSAIEGDNPRRPLDERF